MILVFTIAVLLLIYMSYPIIDDPSLPLPGLKDPVLSRGE